MLEILIATMIGAVALLWYSTKTSNIAFQKLFAALGILLFALMFLQASIMTPEKELNYTDEYSFYWNCSVLRGNCSGTPEPDACLPYTQNQCENIAGCLWSAGTCSGTPTVTCSWLGAYDYTGAKCGETDGCIWGHEETAGTCDRVIVFNEYSDKKGGESVSDGNLALFTIFAFVLILSLIWFIIDYMGIGVSDLGKITRKKPPKVSHLRQ